MLGRLTRVYAGHAEIRARSAANPKVRPRYADQEQVSGRTALARLGPLQIPID